MAMKSLIKRWRYGAKNRAIDAGGDLHTATVQKEGALAIVERLAKPFGLEQGNA